MLKARIEKEAKMLLSEEEYHLLSTLLPYHTTTQINHYFLADQRYVLRIREFPEHNEFLFTLKIKIKDGYQEYEKQIPANDFHDPFVQEVFTQFHIQNIEYLGDMTCIRKHFATNYGEFCLDISSYFGQTDYEFEYELADAEHDDFREAFQLLNRAGLSYKMNPISKFARFLKAKEQVENKK